MKKMSRFFSSLVLIFCMCFSQVLFAGDRSKLSRFTLLNKIQEYQRPDSWAYKNISAELHQFSRSELSPDRMQELFYNELWDANHLICVARIKNNVAQVVPNGNRKLSDREAIILSALSSLCRAVRVPDVMFLFSSHDFYDGGNFPVLTFSKKKSWNSILMPDFEALEGYGNIRANVQEASRQYPWSEKIDKLFWRGATTGGVFAPNSYASFPRSLAVSYSLQHPDLMDARFTNVVQDTPGMSELLQQNGMMGDFVSIGKSLKYKYLVDIDGNANTYSRCFWILLSNSVLFKIDSEYVQWYYSLLQDNQNYISILPDLSDLEGKIYWGRSNDSQLQQIAINGQHTAEHHLSHEAVLAYFFCFLKTLASMQ